MTGKIVVATDGSDTGYRAVAFAADLSEKFGHALCIVHVLMSRQPGEEIARMMEIEGLAKPAMQSDRASDLAPLGGLFPSAPEEVGTARMISALGDNIVASAKQRAEEAGAVDVTTRICMGDVADEILDLAESAKAEIIVLGRRGLGRVREVLLGSVSQKVLHHAGCTVIIVS
jgi:nucleotide-binding universal stress UspA family protein